MTDRTEINRNNGRDEKLFPEGKELYGIYITKHEKLPLEVAVHGMRSIFGRREMLISSSVGDSNQRIYVNEKKITLYEE